MTVEWKLVRKNIDPERTIGELYIGDKLVCYTVEDTERETKIPKVTAIPRGRYQVKRTFSNRFQHDTLELQDVPNFTGIRIHPGNTAVDTEGCILPGFQRTDHGVLDSRFAVAELDKWYDAATLNPVDKVPTGEEVWITITGIAPVAWERPTQGEHVA
jgi:hypothetical protein